MDNAVNIRHVGNGYICSWWEGKDEGVVFEEEDVEKGDIVCMVKLLYFVKEHFGIYYSKHNKYNLEIKVVKNKEAA